jgi:hypothetical protein
MVLYESTLARIMTNLVQKTIKRESTTSDYTEHFTKSVFLSSTYCWFAPLFSVVI